MEERRRQRRVRVAGVAVVRGGAQPPSVWRMADLSLGGASVIGDGALPADRFLFGLHVAGFEAVELEARVLRKQLVTRAGRCALKFVDVSEMQIQMLREIVGADHGPSLVKRRALIVEGHERQAAALAAELVSLGFTPRQVTSPEQAAAWLQKENTDVVVVGERVVETNRWGLLQFVRDTAPEIRRLVMVDDVPGFRLYYAMKAGLVEGLIEPKMSADALARRLLGAAPAKPRARAARRRRRSTAQV